MICSCIFINCKGVFKMFEEALFNRFRTIAASAVVCCCFQDNLLLVGIDYDDIADLLNRH